MHDSNYCLKFLKIKTRSQNFAEILTWGDWLNYKRGRKNKSWLYLYIFTPKICAWGTTSNTSDRLRKACLFNPKPTGKYDRRVDYLMLKIIFKMPTVWVFKSLGKATELESALKKQFGQNHCYRGIPGRCRMEISNNIVEMFKKTTHWKSLSWSIREKFQKYLDKAYFRFLKHPDNPKRTFHFGDSLEPGFLRKVGFANLVPAIEKVLNVEY